MYNCFLCPSSEGEGGYLKVTKSLVRCSTEAAVHHLSLDFHEGVLVAYWQMCCLKSSNIDVV